MSDAIKMTATDETPFYVSPEHLVSWAPATVEISPGGAQVRGSIILVAWTTGPKSVLESADQIAKMRREALAG